MKYLDSPEMCQIPKEDEDPQRPSRPCIEDFSSNIKQSPEPPTPPPPPRHQDLIETQNELQKLTQTMTAFHPIPPPRQVLETVDENLLLTVWFINQKGSLLESNVKLENKSNCQELQNEVLYASLTQIS